MRKQFKNIEKTNQKTAPKTNSENGTSVHLCRYAGQASDRLPEVRGLERHHHERFHGQGGGALRPTVPRLRREPGAPRVQLQDLPALGLLRAHTGCEGLSGRARLGVHACCPWRWTQDPEAWRLPVRCQAVLGAGNRPPPEAQEEWRQV